MDQRKKKIACKKCFNYKNNQWFLTDCKGDKENENGHDNENYYLNVRKWKNKEFFLVQLVALFVKTLKPTKLHWI